MCVLEGGREGAVSKTGTLEFGGGGGGDRGGGGRIGLVGDIGAAGIEGLDIKGGVAEGEEEEEGKLQ